jgi:AAA domain
MTPEEKAALYARIQASENHPDGAAPPDRAATLEATAAQYTPVDWRAAWAGQPEDVEWLIEQYLEAGTSNALYGKPASGKSLLTLEDCLRLVRAGHVVLYIDEENRIVDLVIRLKAFGAKPGELDRLKLYSFARLPPLDTAEGGEHLLALAVASEAVLVVLDTSSRMVKGKENDSDTFLDLYRCSLALLKAREITVLRLDHPGKDEKRGQRGSSAKDGDVDTIWHLTQDADQRTFRFTRVKSRSGHGPSEFARRREFGPLRHLSGPAPELPAEQILCGQLNVLNVPIEAGRPAARKALDAAGIKTSNLKLEAAIRLRKSCPGQLPDSPGSSASDPLPVSISHIDTGRGAAPATVNPGKAVKTATDAAAKAAAEAKNNQEGHTRDGQH